MFSRWCLCHLVFCKWVIVLPYCSSFWSLIAINYWLRNFLESLGLKSFPTWYVVSCNFYFFGYHFYVHIASRGYPSDMLNKKGDLSFFFYLAPLGSNSTLRLTLKFPIFFYFQATLSLAMDILLSNEIGSTNLQQAVGRLINAIVAVLGPELSPGSIFFSRCKVCQFNL